MSECPICVNESVKLVSPPEEYCDHEMCMDCWINVGERNPVCPICRCDLTEWMEELKVNGDEIKSRLINYAKNNLTVDVSLKKRMEIWQSCL